MISKCYRFGRLLSLACVACASEAGEEPTGTSRSAVVGVHTFLYFRCNSTGWGVTAANRLQPGAAPNTFTLSYNVTTPSMLTGFDDCVFTETNQQDGWGTTQSYYRATASPVVVPAGSALSAASSNPQNFQVRYPSLGQYRVTVNWQNRTFAIAAAAETCVDAVPGNDRLDPNRFNLVFVGAGFPSDASMAQAVRRIVDVDGVGRVQTGADGLMQIPVFATNRARFNFLYVSGTQPFAQANPTPEQVSSALFRFERVATCQNGLPNRVIPAFLYRHVIPGGEGYPYGSFGRQYVMIADCDDQAGCADLGAQQANVHELLHTIPCLADEYGVHGDVPANAPVPFTGALAGNDSLHFWAGGSYASCLASAPWRTQIGNGCGQPGVIDCFKPECVDTSTNPPTFTMPFGFLSDLREDCCRPDRPDCIAEVACFRGGHAVDTGIFRPTAGSLLRRLDFPAFTPATYLPPVQAEITRRVLMKGPAVGRTWHPPPYAPVEFGRDCDATVPGFDP